MPADITLINLNLLFMRYGEKVDRECHLPLGCLYLTRALETSGFTVDFRDYQMCESPERLGLPQPRSAPPSASGWNRVSSLREGHRGVRRVA